MKINKICLDPTENWRDSVSIHRPMLISRKNQQRNHAKNLFSCLGNESDQAQWLIAIEGNLHQVHSSFIEKINQNDWRWSNERIFEWTRTSGETSVKQKKPKFNKKTSGSTRKRSSNISKGQREREKRENRLSERLRRKRSEKSSKSTPRKNYHIIFSDSIFFSLWWNLLSDIIEISFFRPIISPSSTHMRTHAVDRSITGFSDRVHVVSRMDDHQAANRIFLR